MSFNGIFKTDKNFLKWIVFVCFSFSAFLYLSFCVVAGYLEKIDLLLMSSVFELKNSVSFVFQKIALFFTVLGEWQVILVITLGVFVYFLLEGKVKEVIFLFISLFLGFISSFLFKIFIGRTRPQTFFSLFETKSFAFPSGHALIAVTFYGFLFYLLFKKAQSKAQKAIVILIALGIIVGIGLSRFYLGVHWLSDVLGGWLLGFTILAGIVLVDKTNKINYFPKDNFLANISPIKINLLLISAFLVFLFLFNFYYFYLSLLGESEKKNVVVTNFKVIVEKSDVKNIFLKPEFPKHASIFGLEEKYPISLIILGSEEKVKLLFEKVGGFLKKTTPLKDMFNFLRGRLESKYEFSIFVPLQLNYKLPLFVFENLNCGGVNGCVSYIWDTNFYYKNKDKTEKFFIVSFFHSGFLKTSENLSVDFNFLKEVVSAELSKSGQVEHLEEFSLTKPMMINFYGKNIFYDGRVYFLNLAD